MSDNQILVSVIIPVHNAKNYLTHSLPSIKKSDYSHLELIVVDDNSTDESLNLEEKYADRIIRMKGRKGPGTARNKGVQASKGSILFFIDTDVRIAPDTISKIVKTMEEFPEIGAVFGSYDGHPLCKDFFSQYRNILHHFVHQNANAEACTFWAGCGAIRREIFLKAGGFPEKYSSPSIEDVELGYKLRKNGKKIRLLKELQVTHLKEWDFFSILKTDIVHRAVPWTRLSCENRLPYDLNFKLSDRISGVISCFLFLSLILMWFWTPLVLLSALFAAVLFFLNKKLYKFFLRKRGFKFALFSVLFHWFYYFYSSITYALFTGIFYIKRFLLPKKSNSLFKI